MILIVVLEKGARKGEELKAPRYANTMLIYNYITTRDIIPNTSNFFLWLPSIYKYRLTNIMDINPPYLLLLL